VLVWSEAWNAKGEKGREYRYLKHTPIQANVPEAEGVKQASTNPDGPRTFGPHETSQVLQNPVVGFS
jgi:hypothetical protein